MAKLRWSGFSSSERAIAGSAVDSTVESRFSMNSPQATISGISIGRGGAVGMGESARRDIDATLPST
jgi:hypothetical protein